MSDIYLGDCREVRSVLADNSVDTIITDPPYGLEFMGKGWDKGVPGVEFWKEFLAVAKPGAMLLAFGGTRTFHRMTAAIEDAGWEIRDCMMWLTGQGFPKSRNFGCKCGGASGQPASESNVRSVHEPDVPSPVDSQEKRREVLQSRLSEQSTSQCGAEGSKPKTADGEQSRLEGGSNVLEQARQLSADQICAVPGGFSADGAEGRIHHGTSAATGPESGPVTEPNGGCASSKPQSAGQPGRKPRASSQQQEPQVSRMGTCLTCGGLRDWRGYGTALKPAWEPIIVAMKPLDGTFAENAEKWGVAGINVDGSRISVDPNDSNIRDHTKHTRETGSIWGNADGAAKNLGEKGRWPANLLLDEEAAAMLDGRTNGACHGAGVARKKVVESHYEATSLDMSGARQMNRFGDSGGASRFFYVAKASKSERGEGNVHPTVKPLKLMEYLCTLTKTPTGGVVLDPFSGSGTTLLAAKNTGREYIGIEQNPEYFEIIKARLGV